MDSRRFFICLNQTIPPAVYEKKSNDTGSNENWMFPLVLQRKYEKFWKYKKYFRHLNFTFLAHDDWNMQNSCNSKCQIARNKKVLISSNALRHVLCELTWRENIRSRIKKIGSRRVTVESSKFRKKNEGEWAEDDSRRESRGTVSLAKREGIWRSNFSLIPAMTAKLF